MYEMIKMHEFTSSDHPPSDSEQFIYNWMLEDDLDPWIEETGGSSMENRETDKSHGKNSLKLS